MVIVRIERLWRFNYHLQKHNGVASTIPHRHVVIDALSIVSHGDLFDLYRRLIFSAVRKKPPYLTKLGNLLLIFFNVYFVSNDKERCC